MAASRIPASSSLRAQNQVLKLTLCIFILYFCSNKFHFLDVAEIHNNELVNKAISFGFVPLNGKWVKDPNKTFAAPICCGWDNGHYLNNTEFCGNKELSQVEMVGRKDFLAQTGGLGCECTKRGFVDEYTWTTTSTTGGIENKKWNAHEACDKLGSRRVLMIGDSTMGQTAATLMNALFPAGCQTQFTYAISDTLVGVEMGNLNRGDNWTNLVEKYNPDIVLVSAGPHVYKRSNVEIVMNSVIEGTKMLKKDRPHLEVVWKTNNAASCTDDIVDEIEINKVFQWDEFYERDLYALSVFPWHSIHVIDMRMLYYRSDAHVNPPADCLHLCIPGPLDVIAPLFSELLDKLGQAD